MSTSDVLNKFLVDNTGKLTRGQCGDVIGRRNTEFVRWNCDRWVTCSRNKAEYIAVWDSHYGLIVNFDYPIKL